MSNDTGRVFEHLAYRPRFLPTQYERDNEYDSNAVGDESDVFGEDNLRPTHEKGGNCECDQERVHRDPPS